VFLEMGRNAPDPILAASCRISQDYFERVDQLGTGSTRKMRGNRCGASRTGAIICRMSD
jgi:hypothetical protein